MFRSILFFIVIFPCLVFTQNNKIAVISNLLIDESDNKIISELINDINSSDEIKFVVLNGNISKSGKDIELQKANKLFKNFTKPFFVLPGNSDLENGESGGILFQEFWNEFRFSFEIDSTYYFGLNSTLRWFNGKGHIAPEDISWLKEELAAVPENNDVVLFLYNDVFNSIDNWAKLFNSFNSKKLQIVFIGNSKKQNTIKNKILPAFGSTLINSKKKTNYLLFESVKDSINIYSKSLKQKPKLVKSIIKNKKSFQKYYVSQGVKKIKANVVWKSDLDYSLNTPPLLYKRNIITSDVSGLVTCFDSLGKKLWEYDAFGDVLSTPAASDNMLAVATLQGDLSSINILNGEANQTIGFDNPISTPLTILDYKGKRRTMIPKQTNSNAALVFGSTTGEIFCYDLETLEELWKSKISSKAIRGNPLITNNRVVVSSTDGYLYCIDARDGVLIWKWTPAKDFDIIPSLVAPVTDGKTIFIASPNKFVYAIDLKLGRTVWKNSKFDAYSSISISKDKRKLYVKGKKGKFHIIDKKNGHWVKEIKVKYGTDLTDNPAIEWKGNQLFAAGNGYVYLVKPRNKKYKPVSILQVGNKPLHKIQKYDNSSFIISSYDGEIILFKISSNY